MSIVRDFPTKRLVPCFFCLLLIASFFTVTTPSAHAITSSLNVITNLSFEDGLNPITGYPLGWGNWTKHGTADSTITVNSTLAINGTYSARLEIGKKDIGFIALFQNLPPSLRFRNLSDRPDGLDFWFYLEPKYAGLGDFRVRVLYGENVAELNYVFDADPFLSYPNVTDALGNPEAKSILLSGYPAGQWHHVQRNLKADWQAPMKLLNGSYAPGFSLDIAFARLQFDALAFQNPPQSGDYYAETLWLDQVKVYQDIQTPAHWASFNFLDLNGNNVGQYVQWKLFNSTDKDVGYNMGEATLPQDMYNLEVYYPNSTGQNPEPFRIYRQAITLDQVNNINLAMIPQPSYPGSYITFDGPVTARVTAQNTTALSFTASGSAGTSAVLRAPARPKAILRNGVELTDAEWSYDPTYSTVRLTTPDLGQFALIFTNPLRLPSIGFLDLTGRAVDNAVTFRILYSKGGEVINPTAGLIVINDTYTLEAYYEGYRIYSQPLDFARTSPVYLEMLSINTSQNAYVSLNSTVTSFAIVEQSSQRLYFKIDGTGPVQIVVKVPKKPLYVEKNGEKLFWSYNSSSKTVAIDTQASGTFSVVYETGIPTIYLVAVGVLAAAIVATAFILLWRKRRTARSTSSPPSISQ